MRGWVGLVIVSFAAAFSLLAPSCLAAGDDAFLMNVSRDTWNYLSSDWATANHMPWSWISSSMSGGDYANPAEIGFYMLSWIGAYEMNQSWGPGWTQTESEVTSVLDRLETWQSGLQSDGPHAYSNSVFYRAYWINWNPPRVGDGSYNHEVPSIDNAWLAASLITIEEYAKANGKAALQTKAHNVLKDMNFSFWYHPGTHLFTWGSTNNPQGGGYCDYYSNENRITNFVARALGFLNESEFRLSLDAMARNPAAYNGTTVEKVNWDGSYFTYAAPGLFINESGTSYGRNTTDRAAEAQMRYAADKGYSIWGISDCFDKLSGGYVLRGAPPRGSGSSSTDPDTGLITPHASALALITGFSANASDNLQRIKGLYPSAYNASYGFLDSIDVNTNQASYRFSALNQEWTFLSLMNYFNGTIWKYFYMNENVSKAHAEMFNASSSSNGTGNTTNTTIPNGTNVTYPPNYITVCKSGCMYSTINGSVNAATSGNVVFVTDGGVYAENVTFGGWGGKSNVTLDCNGSTIMGSGSGYGIYMSKGSSCMIKNCIIRNFKYGIYAWDGYGHSFVNNTLFNNSRAFYFDNSDYHNLIGNNVSYNEGGIYIFWWNTGNTIEGNLLMNNTVFGVVIDWDAHNNTVRNNVAKGNGYGIMSGCSYGDKPANTNNYSGNIALYNTYGFYLCMSDNNTVENNTMAGNTYGLFLSGKGNKIYNNLFNNTQNTLFQTPSPNAWNTTLQYKANIIGGPRTGGNFWAYPNGTGFSETCNDTNRDGICDSAFGIAANNTDFLPLKRFLAGDVDGNCAVNIFDLAAVGLAFGSSPGNANWNANADINSDSVINIFDLATVGINFGKSC